MHSLGMQSANEKTTGMKYIVVETSPEVVASAGAGEQSY